MVYRTDFRRFFFYLVGIAVLLYLPYLLMPVYVKSVPVPLTREFLQLADQFADLLQKEVDGKTAAPLAQLIFVLFFSCAAAALLVFPMVRALFSPAQLVGENGVYRLKDKELWLL